MRSNKSCSTAKSVFAILLTLLLAMALASDPARAQKFKVLHTFHGKDGAYPVGVLVRDAAGNLYGTTGAGGSGNCSGGEGCGTAFKLDKTSKQVWLHKFDGANGAGPNAGLLRDATGNLFGTTLEGGDIECYYPYGCGTVFSLDRMGKEKVLHRLTNTPDGLFPDSPVVEDSLGNLYGTTEYGGAFDVYGMVFKVDKNGKESVLYSFTGGSDECRPVGVTFGPDGYLYGVAQGSSVCNATGAVFKLDTAGNFTLLCAFGGSDGEYPDSVLMFDAQGNIYGTTADGGTGCGGTGCGVVFKLSAQSGWSESVLYDFCSLSNCADGEEPGGGPLVMDHAGNLYGTTYYGGASHNCDGGGCGTVFKLGADGKETVLYSFTDGADGAFPVAGVVMDNHGNLYGTTESGGASCYTKYTCGVVFEITP